MAVGRDPRVMSAVVGEGLIVGAGKRLFGDTSQTKRLRLTEARTVGDDGVHFLIYEKAGNDAPS